jgi:hypothetical protein
MLQLQLRLRLRLWLLQLQLWLQLLLLKTLLVAGPLWSSHDALTSTDC